MNTLENAVINDIPTLPFDFCESLDILFTDIKEYVSLILIHIIILSNDNSLKQELSFTKDKHSSISSGRKGEKMVNAYYKDKQLNHNVMQILIRVLNEARYENKSEEILKTAKEHKFFNETLENLIDNLFMLIASTNQDQFYISCRLINQDHIDYYTSTSKNNIEIINLKKEMKEIKDNLVFFVEDFMSGFFSTVEAQNKNHSIESSVKYLSNWIFDLMSRKSNLAKAKYFKQMICAEHNIIEVLLTIIRLIMGKHEYVVSMLMMFRVLTIICEDNMTTQSQLFIGSAKVQFEYINSKSPLIFSLCNRNIFLNNN